MELHCWLDTFDVFFRSSLSYHSWVQQPPPSCSSQHPTPKLRCPLASGSSSHAGPSKSRPPWGPKATGKAELRLSGTPGKGPEGKRHRMLVERGWREVNREVGTLSYKLHSCWQDSRGCPLPGSRQAEALAEAHPVLGGLNPQLHLKVSPVLSLDHHPVLLYGPCPLAYQQQR